MKANKIKKQSEKILQALCLTILVAAALVFASRPASGMESWEDRYPRPLGNTLTPTASPGTVAEPAHSPRRAPASPTPEPYPGPYIPPVTTPEPTVPPALQTPFPTPTYYNYTPTSAPEMTDAP